VKLIRHKYNLLEITYLHNNISIYIMIISIIFMKWLVIHVIYIHQLFDLHQFLLVKFVWYKKYECGPFRQFFFFEILISHLFICGF